MAYRNSLIVSALMTLVGQLSIIAHAAVNYDLGFYDFGNLPGNADLTTFSTSNMTSTLTTDGVQWKRSGTSNTSVTFTPTTAYTLSGAFTIDIAIRRLASDSNGGTSWDNVVELCGSDGSKYRQILLGNGDTSPAFTSDPNNSDFQVYRFVTSTQTGKADIYVNNDASPLTQSNLWNGGSVPKIVFSVQSNRSSAQGFEIAWIGISSAVSREAPNAYAVPEAKTLGLLGLGSILMMRKP